MMDASCGKDAAEVKNLKQDETTPVCSLASMRATLRQEYLPFLYTWRLEASYMI